MQNIAIFASGRGSNFQQIFRGIKSGDIPGRICCLITDRPGVGAVEFAVRNHIDFKAIPPGDYPDDGAFAEALLSPLTAHKTDWIVLAGYLKKIPGAVVSRFNNRILNIHPALLPAFGGKGMYGMHVHRAVFAAGVKVSGVTVHLVNTEYDSGPIVAQKAVEIGECRDPEEIAAKVLQVEHELYPRAVKKILTRPFHLEGKRVVFK